MENQTSKIVFYKSRSLAGRFSAAFDFIENNFKILVKLGSFILLPMAVIISLLFNMFGNLALEAQQAKSFTPELTKYLIALFLFVLVNIVGSVLFKGLVYTLVKEYPLRDSLERIQFKSIKDK